MDVLTDAEWYEVYRGSDEIGYCLYDPVDEWRPQDVEFPIVFADWLMGDALAWR